MKRTKSSKTKQAVSMVDLGMTMEELRGHPLDLITREGSRVILEAALEEEVEVVLERRYERRGEGWRGYRNGASAKTSVRGGGDRGSQNQRS